MANFLINSPSSEQVGSTTSDLFVLQAGNGVSTFGIEGTDSITASAALVASAMRLNGGKGSDTISLSGGTTENSFVLGGMGKDVLVTDNAFTASVVRGGAGLDTLSFSASIFTRATVNGNDMADVISAGIDSGSVSSFIAGGLGSDVITAFFDDGADAFTINGGAGHDTVNIDSTAAGNLSSLIVAGGNGFDTITLDSTASTNLNGAFNINGDALADNLRFQGTVSGTTTASIGGGAGADTIQFSASASLDAGFINAGVGNDSIYFSAAFNGGTLNGGAGKDSISLGVFATGINSSVSFGDAGSDIFSLNSGSIQTVTGTTRYNSGGGTQLGYSDFTQSTLGEMDTVSAGFNFVSASGVAGVSADLFQIRTDVVDAIAANGIAVAAFSGTQGVAAFTSTFSTNLTARVEQLDTTLAVGNVIGFTDGTTDYVFVQGGAAAGGTSDDLLLSLNTSVGGITVSSNSAIAISVSTTFT